MEEDAEIKTVQAEEEDGVVMYDAKRISKTFHVNVNKATAFLKRFGLKIGHWQIEQNKLLRVLAENEGVLL